MTHNVTMIELMPRQRLPADVVKLSTRHAGIIQGDDEYGFAVGADSLLLGGFGHRESSLGLRASYRIFFSAGVKIPSTVNVGPTHEVTSLYPEEPQ
jgi:hypothetical protein